MKTFLKLTVLSAVLLAAIGSSLNAATGPVASSATGHARLHALVRRHAAHHHVAKKLGLTSDQIAQLKATRASTATTIKGIRADQSLTADQKKAKVREALQGARKTMQGALTAEQRAKLQHFRAKHHKHSPRG
jgi:Spy/CpxP family protein refolding chaperone